MEKVRLTLVNGEILAVEHDSKDNSFDEVMKFNDSNFIVKAKNGTRVPIRNILKYQVDEETTSG
jgi:hypothetical protein